MRLCKKPWLLSYHVVIYRLTYGVLGWPARLWVTLSGNTNLPCAVPIPGSGINSWEYGGICTCFIFGWLRILGISQFPTGMSWKLGLVENANLLGSPLPNSKIWLRPNTWQRLRKTSFIIESLFQYVRHGPNITNRPQSSSIVLESSPNRPRIVPQSRPETVEYHGGWTLRHGLGSDIYEASRPRWE